MFDAANFTKKTPNPACDLKTRLEAVTGTPQHRIILIDPANVASSTSECGKAEQDQEACSESDLEPLRNDQELSAYHGAEGPVHIMGVLKKLPERFVGTSEYLPTGALFLSTETPSPTTWRCPISSSRART